MTYGNLFAVQQFQNIHELLLTQLYSHLLPLSPPLHSPLSSSTSAQCSKGLSTNKCLWLFLRKSKLSAAKDLTFVLKKNLVGHSSKQSSLADPASAGGRTLASLEGSSNLSDSVKQLGGNGAVIPLNFWYAQ